MADVADIVTILDFYLQPNFNGKEWIGFEFGYAHADAGKITSPLLRQKRNKRVTSGDADFKGVVAELERNSPLPRMLAWARKEAQERGLDSIGTNDKGFHCTFKTKREIGGAIQDTLVMTEDDLGKLRLYGSMLVGNSYGSFSSAEIGNDEVVFKCKISLGRFSGHDYDTYQEVDLAVLNIDGRHNVGFLGALKEGDADGFRRLLGEATLEKITPAVQGAPKLTKEGIAQQFLDAPTKPLIEFVSAHAEMTKSLQQAMRSRV